MIATVPFNQCHKKGIKNVLNWLLNKYGRNGYRFVNIEGDSVRLEYVLGGDFIYTYEVRCALPVKAVFPMEMYKGYLGHDYRYRFGNFVDGKWTTFIYENKTKRDGGIINTNIADNTDSDSAVVGG